MTGTVTGPTAEELSAELSATVEELHRTRAELDRARAALASSVSHELRSPLASIQGYVELLEDGELGHLSPTSAAAVRTIGRNAERLGVLLDDLLQEKPPAAASPDPVLQLTDVDLGNLVRQSQVALHSVARTRHLELTVTLPPRLRRIQADAAQIEQVVLNLVGNALKFTPEGGQVSVVIESSTDGVVLIVTDNGIGIPRGELDSLFSRFFRSSLSVNREIEGKGLGLATAKSIIDDHQGRITVDSTEGAGTTVRVSLPSDPVAQGGLAAWRRNHHRPATGSTNGTNA